MNITQSHVNMCIEIYNFTKNKKNKNNVSTTKPLYLSQAGLDCVAVIHSN